MEEKVFYLTFDGSPNPPATDKLLHKLDQYAIQATFFMEGKRLEKESDCARRVLAAGHDIGNHSYNHPSFDAITIEECIREVEMTQAILTQELGITPYLLRPPVGILPPLVGETFLNRGFDIILWSYSVKDWEGPDSRNVARRIIEPAFPGAIVALHDRYEDLMQTLDIVIPFLRQQGYVFKRISAARQHGIIKSISDLKE